MTDEAVQGTVNTAIEWLITNEKRINESALEEFKAKIDAGRVLVQVKQENGGRMPHKFMARLAERSGRSARDWTYRIQASEVLNTAEKIGTAVRVFNASWSEAKKYGFDVERKLHPKPKQVATRKPTPRLSLPPGGELKPGEVLDVVNTLSTVKPRTLTAAMVSTGDRAVIKAIVQSATEALMKLGI